MDSSTFVLRPPETAGAKPLRYLAFTPNGAPRQPPIVLVHGNGRVPESLFRAFLPFATAHDIPLLAPRFSRNGFPAYQQLASTSDLRGAQTALDAALADAKQTLGIDTELINLVGFSGGAQFAHRYAMVAPHRVIQVVAVAAGWYTTLDPGIAFPRGLAATEARPDLQVDPVRFLQIPLRVMVGELDVEQDDGLRTSPWLTRTQGANRVDRARSWVAHLERRARDLGLVPSADLEILPGTGHSLSAATEHGGLVRRVLAYLHPLLVDLVVAEPASTALTSQRNGHPG